MYLKYHMYVHDEDAALMSKHRHIHSNIHPRRRNFGKLVNQRGKKKPPRIRPDSGRVYKLEGAKSGFTYHTCMYKYMYMYNT